MLGTWGGENSFSRPRNIPGQLLEMPWRVASPMRQCSLTGFPGYWGSRSLAGGLQASLVAGALDLLLEGYSSSSFTLQVCDTVHFHQICTVTQSAPWRLSRSVLLGYSFTCCSVPGQVDSGDGPLCGILADKHIHI